MDRLFGAAAQVPEDVRRRLREEKREKRLREHQEVWLTQILPSYQPGTKATPRMQKLWRQGLPPKVREVLWPMAIGNVLRITPQLFDIHKQQAMDARRAQALSRAPGLRDLVTPLSDLTFTRGCHGKESSKDCIPIDLSRTFPTLAFFHEGGPYHEDCSQILEAYTFYRPDIGYVQGMNFLAAMLLLNLPPYDAFVGLCNMLNAPSVLGLYRLEQSAVQCRARIFRELCESQLPAVGRIIDEVGLTPEMFLIEWFITIYAKCLPIDVASVVWDLFLLDGEVVLYCTALALLRITEPVLLEEECASLEHVSRVLGKDLRHRVTDPDELLWHIQEVSRRCSSQLTEAIRSIANEEFGSRGADGGGRTLSGDSFSGFRRTWSWLPRWGSG